MSERDDCHPDVWANLACCYFMLGMYKESDAMGSKAPGSSLINRLQFHLAHKVSSYGFLESTRQCVWKVLMCVSYNVQFTFKIVRLFMLYTLYAHFTFFFSSVMRSV